MEKIIKFTDLIAWKESHKLVLIIYKITKTFPVDEKFSLSNQMQRAVVSITSNIAEGFGRNTKNDKIHFLSMAKCSLFEIYNQIIISKDLGYINSVLFSNIEEQISICSRLISGLIKSAENKKL